MLFTKNDDIQLFAARDGLGTEQHSIVALSDGGYVGFWLQYDPTAAVLQALPTAAAPDNEITVIRNTNGAFAPTFTPLDLIDLGAGRVMAVWHRFLGERPDGSAHSQVQGQIYTTDGMAVGTAIALTPRESINRHGAPEFATLTDGRIAMMKQVISPNVFSTTPFSFEISILDNAGVATSVRVAPSPMLTGLRALSSYSIEAAHAGGFYVVHVNNYPVSIDDFEPVVQVQKYDQMGATVGSVVEINFPFEGGFGGITPLANGGFVATFDQLVGRPGNMLPPEFLDNSVFVHVYDAQGNLTADPFLASLRGQGLQLEPTTIALDDGRFIVLWNDTVFLRTGGRDTSVRAQIFNSDGSRAGGEEIIVSNLDRPGDDLKVGGWRYVDLSTDGDLFLTWEELGPSEGPLFSQTFDVANTLIATRGDDSLWLTFGNDRINAGKGNDFVSANSGNDNLSGWLGDDTLIGGTGTDILVGGDGNDKLYGGGGNDLLFGGRGADEFHFNSFPTDRTDVDSIRDFVSGVDRIVIENNVFAALGRATGALAPGLFNTGTVASDRDDRIIYDPVTGRLFFDADGVGSRPSVLLAVLSGAADLAASDLFVS